MAAGDYYVIYEDDEWKVKLGGGAVVSAGHRTQSGAKRKAETLGKNNNRGDLVWDVGAHQGNYSCLAAALGARVRAFEPTPGGYARCVENLEANGHEPARAGGPTAVDPARAGDPTTVDGRALSDHTAHGTTATVPECSPTATLGEAGTYEAPVVAGDSLDETPDRIKIDVEGHERAVLRGLTETLPDVERVVVEVHGGGDGQGCLDILQTAGFETRALPCSRPHTFIGAWRA